MLFFVTIINVILFLGNLYQTGFNYFNFNQLQALLLTIFLIVTVIVIAINKKLERGYDLSFLHFICIGQFMFLKLNYIIQQIIKME